MEMSKGSMDLFADFPIESGALTALGKEDACDLHFGVQILFDFGDGVCQFLQANQGK